MKPARERLAVDFGKKLVRAQAQRGHSVQKTHDLIKAKGFEHPPDTRTIQRHQAGEMYPWPTTREMYAAVYPDLEE